MTPSGLKTILPCAALAAFAAAVLLAAAPPVRADDGPRTETVTIAVESGPNLAGTLTFPDGPVRAALAMVTGTGPHSRDGVISGAPMFALLAEALAAEGIATLRVDESGVGDSTGEVTDSFLERVPHVAATLAYLREQPAFAGLPVGLYGHSEGASLAVLVHGQQSGAADFLVLAGAPGEAGRTVWVDQQYALLHGQFAHMGEDAMTQMRAALGAVADASIAGERAATYDATRALFELLQAPPSVYEDGSFEQYASRMAGAGMRDFLGYDPAPAFAAVEIPVLAIWGEIDRLTAPGLNAPPLIAASHPASDLTTLVLANADHFFLFSPDLAPGEHAFGRMQLDMALPAAIAAWIARLTDGG